MTDSPAPKLPTPQSSLFARLPVAIWALLCAALWGSAFPVIKQVYGHWEEQAIATDFAVRSAFAGIRFILAGTALLLLARAPWTEWKATPRRYLLAMAGTQTVGQYVCFYLGIGLSSGVLASLLVSAGSFWWMLLAPLFLPVQRPSGRQWGILLVGAIGVTLAVYAPGVSEGRARLGALLILGASLFGALGIIAFRFIQPTMGARAGTGFSLFLGGVVLLLAGMPAWGELGILFDPYTAGWTLWLAFVSAAAFALWNQLSTIYPVHLVATYRFLIPLCAMTESLLFLEGERLTLQMGIGGCLVLGAVVLAQRNSGTKKAAS